jgi:2,3-bisphosphoglycerate-independent phosphoglycerate mutase
MDRDNRWDRVQLAHGALIQGEGTPSRNAQAAIADAWAAGENDEFILPRIIDGTHRIERGDSVVFFNFRADRARHLTESLVSDDFDAFPVPTNMELNFCSLTEYKDSYTFPCAYLPTSLEMVFGELAEEAGLKQLRVAETEKYAHVTFFFNGGREAPFEGEDRVLVPSPRIPTYDLQPEMSAPGITEAVLAGIKDAQHDVFIMNYANPDMVGHTGKFDAAVAAVESVDHAVRQVTDAVLERGGSVLLTADHGNVEQMFDATTGQAHTAHTINPVP